MRQPFGAALFAACLLVAPAALAAEAPSARSPTYTTESSDGVPIAYDVKGEGLLALVFVHGWSTDRTYWREQVEPFSRGFKVVTVDLAGHGESGTGRKEWSIEAFGDDVAAVVRKLSLRRAVF